MTSAMSSRRSIAHHYHRIENNSSNDLRQHGDLPLRRQLVQPTHFEHLVLGGSVEAGVRRDVRPRRDPQSAGGIRVEVTLHHRQRSVLGARGRRAHGETLGVRRETWVQAGSRQNAGALVHRGVVVLVGVGERCSGGGNVFLGFLPF